MGRHKTALENRLTKIAARISEIEGAYPDIVKVKSYSRNFNATNTAYQEFGAIAKEYRDLLDDEERISLQLDEYDGTTGGSYLADFRSE